MASSHVVRVVLIFSVSFLSGNYCPVCGECYSDSDYDSKVRFISSSVEGFIWEGEVSYLPDVNTLCASDIFFSGKHISCSPGSIIMLFIVSRQSTLALAR